jgi:hypothetical protein
LYGYGPTVNNYMQLDRPLLSKHFQILRWYCEQIVKFVNDGTRRFLADSMSTAFLLSRKSFEVVTAELIGRSVQLLLLSELRRAHHFHIDMLQLISAPTAFNSDWSLEYGNESNGYLIRSVPRMFSNTSCNCMASGHCREPLRIGPPDLLLPGLFVGCLPVDGLRMSTLECFFSSSCISSILTHLEYYTQQDGSLPTNFSQPSVLPFSIIALNNSKTSRFPTNTTIGTLIDEFFLEEYTNTTSYEDYVAGCAPTYCEYNYMTRNNILYVATSVLGLYGGLTVSFRFLIWNLTRLYQLIKIRIRSRRAIAQS